MIKYKYTVVDTSPISEGAWTELNRNNELAEAGYTIEDFVSILIESEGHRIGVFSHKSFIEVPEQLDYIIQQSISNKLQHEKETTIE